MTGYDQAKINFLLVYFLYMGIVDKTLTRLMVVFVILMVVLVSFMSWYLVVSADVMVRIQ